MSGGAYDYYQYHIQDIIDRIEREVEDATKERPAKVTRKFTSVSREEEFCDGCKREVYLTQYADRPFVEVRTRFVNDPNMDIIEDTDTMLVVRNQFDDIYRVRDCSVEEYPDGEYYPDYTEETLQEFRNGIAALRRAYVYAQRIDWILSGDDNEESFHRRLKDELEKLNEKEE